MVKNGLYMLWHHVLQLPVYVFVAPRTSLVLPRQCSRPHFVSTFELPQQASGSVIIAGTDIGPVEHEGVDVHTKFMACLGRVLKPLNWRRQ
jgi:hypothetical protein